MSGPSKVIVLEPDPQAGRQVQLGFEREGVATYVPAVPSEPAQLSDLASEVPGLVLIGGIDGQAVDLVRRARELVGPDVPIVSTARGASRADLEAAGADEVVARPSYLRDLVTICRILRGSPAGKRDHLVGSLVETTGVYTLVRALSSLGRSAVLTLIRGLRRGEVRFYRGEVTSAEVGLIHGQAALHQLLLWTDARFDFAHEDIVRRQQIPLTPDELFADAERFLEGVREHAGRLSPATVLEQDVPRIQSLGTQVPTEVHGVLRMFDGHRVLADILEDSPYRVFETLRVAQKAVEVGLLKTLDAQRPKATWRAVLAIDEWLVGTDTREAVVERTAEIDSGPVSSTTARRKGKGKSRSKRAKPATPPAGIRAEIDWGALVPRTIGVEVGPLAGVVPSHAAAGEVTVASRDREREKLEALMDTDKRDRIFPKEIGIEPSIVVADDAAPTAKVIASAAEAETVTGKKKRKKKTEKSGPVGRVTPPPAELDAAAKAEADARAKAEADASERRAKEVAEQNAREAEAEPREAQAKAREAQEAAREAAARAEAIGREAEAKAREAAEAAEQQARVAASVERMRLDRIAREEAEQKAREEAARAAAAEEARTYAARVKAAAEAKREEAERAAREKAIADAERDRANAEAERAARERDVADALAKDPAAAAMIAIPTSGPIKMPDAAAAVAAADATAAAPRDRDPARTDARALVRDLVSEAVPPSTTGPVVAEPSILTAAPAAKSNDDELATTAFVRPSIEPEPAPAPDPIRAHIALPLNVVEAGHTRVAVADLVTVTTTDTTARVTSIPKTLITEEPAIAEVASTTPALTASSGEIAAEPRGATIRPPSESDATPKETDDEPSDGVVRAMIATADTARVAARARAARPPAPEHDGPVVKEATGEIRERTPRTDLPQRRSEPTILVADLAPSNAAAAQAAAATAAATAADLAAAHKAIAAVAAKPATPPPADAASPAREAEVNDIRRDAHGFDEHEEAFFNRAESGTNMTPKFESFDDLDDGYQPVGFWDRVFGRTTPKKK